MTIDRDWLARRMVADQALRRLIAATSKHRRVKRRDRARAWQQFDEAFAAYHECDRGR